MQEDSVWNFDLIEVEIHMEHSDICRRLPCELDFSCTSKTAESRAMIWYQKNTFKAPSALGCCPFVGGYSVVVDF